MTTIHCSADLIEMHMFRQQLRSGVDIRWHKCPLCGVEVRTEAPVNLLDAVIPGSPAATLLMKMERIRARRKALPTVEFGGVIRQLLDDEDVMMAVIEMLEPSLAEDVQG